MTVVWRLSGRRPLVCVWQPLVYDAKNFSGDFNYGKKNWTTGLLEILSFQWNYGYRIIENVTWVFWGVYSIENANIWVQHLLWIDSTLCGSCFGYEARRRQTTIMRRHFPAWLWLNFWLNSKEKSLLSHRIRQIWLLVTFPVYKTQISTMGNAPWVDWGHKKKFAEGTKGIGSKGAYFEGDNKNLY